MSRRGRVDSSANIWIVVDNLRGHRLWYVRLLVQDARSSGAEIVVVSLDVSRSEQEWKENLTDLEQSFTLEPFPGWSQLLERASDRGARIVTPDADRVLKDVAVAALRRRLRGQRLPLISLLLMRSRPQGGRFAVARFVLKTVLAVALARSRSVEVVRLELLDELRPGLLTKLGLPVVLDPVELVACPAGRSEWLTSRGLSEEKPVCVVLGDVAERKNAPEIVRAWGMPDNGDAQLVLAGRIDAATQAALGLLSTEQRQKVFCFEGFLDSGDFDMWINIADWLIALQSTPASSGVILKAWAAGTPVLVPAGGLLEDACRRLELTYAVVPPTAKDIAQWAAKASARSAYGTGSPRSDMRGFTKTLLGI